jgi:hypothetical protein
MGPTIKLISAIAFQKWRFQFDAVFQRTQASKASHAARKSWKSQAKEKPKSA